jgi:transposase
VLQIPVPWAEPRSGFTTLMESRIIDWLDESSLSGVSRVQHVSWRKVDVVMARAVKRGLGRRGPVSPEGIGVDEKARSKGNEYVTIVTDLDEEEGKVLHIADGREKKALASFYEDIGPEACARIQVAAMDMSNAYVSATREYVPDADNKIAFDRFHVAQHLAKAVDQVRRAENKDLVATGDERLKRTRYLWLKNPENQTPKNLARFRKLEKTSLRTARAWRLKEIARFLWDPRPRMHALLDWAAWWIKARKSGLAPVRRVAETVRNHAWGIATAIHLGVTNARSESFNAAIQKISGRAHGFRSTPRFKTAIYFYLGGVDMHPRSAPST